LLSAAEKMGSEYFISLAATAIALIRSPTTTATYWQRRNVL